jgi:putative tricarboxylic transport membrane protein
MTLTKDRVGALIFLALSIAYGISARQIDMFPGDEDLPFNSQTLPIALSWLMGICSFLLLVQPPKPEDGSFMHAFEGLNWGVLFKLAGLMVLYGFGLYWAGFIPSTILFLILGFMTLGERRVGVILGSSVPVVVVFWALLTQLLGIYLTPGELYYVFGGS